MIQIKARKEKKRTKMIRKIKKKRNNDHGPLGLNAWDAPSLIKAPEGVKTLTASSTGVKLGVIAGFVASAPRHIVLRCLLSSLPSTYYMIDLLHGDHGHARLNQSNCPCSSRVIQEYEAQEKL